MFNPYYSPPKKKKLTKLPRKKNVITTRQSELSYILKHQTLAHVKSLYAECAPINNVTYDHELPADVQLTNKLTDKEKKSLKIDDRYVRVTHKNGVELTPHRYFFRSTAESRPNNELKGIWLPLEPEIVIKSPFSDNIQYSKAEGKYLQKIEITQFDEALIEKLYKYGRFIDEENVCISKYLVDKGV